MPDPSYLIENLKQELALEQHLTTNFYPPLPAFVKEAFVEVFVEYWKGGVSTHELDIALSERAYYTGGVGKYNLWQFLNDEDVQ